MENTKISKTIHYCWFGKGEKPELFYKCFDTWKKFCPDYNIIEWNEENFDVNLCEYTKQAYEKKQYAFVSDVARVWIIYNYGGIYLDTDVELISDISPLLYYDAWFASESAKSVATGLGFGAKKYHFIPKAILDDYIERDFIDLSPCAKLNTQVIRQVLNGFEYADKTGVYDDVIVLSSKDYGSYANHLYASSWADNSKKKDSRFRWKLLHFLERPKILKYCDSHNNIISKAYSFLLYELIACGFKHCFGLFVKRIKKK
jgi:mannosyltransferase OCH1-like enzyme